MVALQIVTVMHRPDAFLGAIVLQLCMRPPSHGMISIMITLHYLLPQGNECDAVLIGLLGYK